MRSARTADTLPLGGPLASGSPAPFADPTLAMARLPFGRKPGQAEPSEWPA